jgi:hypothetical protein
LLEESSVEASESVGKITSLHKRALGLTYHPSLALFTSYAQSTSYKVTKQNSLLLCYSNLHLLWFAIINVLHDDGDQLFRGKTKGLRKSLVFCYYRETEGVRHLSVNWH